MTASLQKSLLLQQTAAEHIAKCRAILTGDEQTPEQAELSHWWKNLTREKRRAMFLLAGIQHGNTGASWAELKTTQRAALVLAVRAFVDNTRAILSSLDFVRENARQVLHRERERVSYKPKKEAA